MQCSREKRCANSVHFRILAVLGGRMGGIYHDAHGHVSDYRMTVTFGSPLKFLCSADLFRPVDSVLEVQPKQRCSLPVTVLLYQVRRSGRRRMADAELGAGAVPAPRLLVTPTQVNQKPMSGAQAAPSPARKPALQTFTVCRPHTEAIVRSVFLAARL